MTGAPMSDDGTTTWQPLSALPQIERDINEQFDNTRELYEHLCQGRDRPHLLDDALVERVLRHVADQVEFLPVYREQLARWYRSQPTAPQFLESNEELAQGVFSGKIPFPKSGRPQPRTRGRHAAPTRHRAGSQIPRSRVGAH